MKQPPIKRILSRMAGLLKFTASVWAMIKSALDAHTFEISSRIITVVSMDISTPPCPRPRLEVDAVEWWG